MMYKLATALRMLSLALLLAHISGHAYANLIVDFEFTNADGNGGGIVTGQIFGLVDDTLNKQQ